MCVCVYVHTYIYMKNIHTLCKIYIFFFKSRWRWSSVWKQEKGCGFFCSKEKLNHFLCGVNSNSGPPDSFSFLCVYFVWALPASSGSVSKCPGNSFFRKKCTRR